jgi:hypothetical protein
VETFEAFQPVALQDPHFQELVGEQWRSLRGNAMSNTTAQNLLATSVAQMTNSANRTYNHFRSIIPAMNVTSWTAEVSQMQHWVMQRLAWMDDALAEL